MRTVHGSFLVPNVEMKAAILLGRQPGKSVPPLTSLLFLQAIAELRTQYRMAEDIQLLSNALIYGGRMRCGSEDIRHQKLEICIPDILPENPLWLQKVWIGDHLHASLSQYCSGEGWFEWSSDLGIRIQWSVNCNLSDVPGWKNPESISLSGLMVLVFSTAHWGLIGGPGAETRMQTCLPGYR